MAKSLRSCRTFLAAALLLPFACAGATAQTTVAPAAKPAEAPAGNADNGKRLFASYGCYECHGRLGQGTAVAPRIGPPAIPVTMVLRYVRQPTGQMPPYTAKVLADQDLADIVAYLKSRPMPARASTIPLLNQ